MDIFTSKLKRPKVIISSTLELESMLVVGMVKEKDLVELVETSTMMVPLIWDQEPPTSMVDSEDMARKMPFQKDVVMEQQALRTTRYLISSTLTMVAMRATK